MKKRLEPVQQQSFRKPVQRSKNMTKVLCFTSGKGGVGKTNTVVNLGLCLAKMGRSVLVLDADFSLANVDLLLSLPVRSTVEDVVNGRCSLEETIIEHESGLCLLPAASGPNSAFQFGAREHHALFQALEEVSSSFDYLLIDTPAGIGQDVTFFCSAAHHVFFLVHPEPPSITDSFALMKILSSRHGLKDFQLILNCVENEQSASRVFGRMSAAVAKHLHVDAHLFGWIPKDAAVFESVCERGSVVEKRPSSPAACSFHQMARKIEQDLFDYQPHGGLQFFFERLIEDRVSN